MTVTRTVIVADRTAPVITMNGSGTVNITKDGTYIDAGATWTDLIDGSGAIIGNSNVNTSTVGTYTVTYDHIDAAGNTGTTLTRTVNVVTGGIPVITLIGSGTVDLLAGSGYTESGATAFDVEDGAIASGSISISGSVNTNVPGTYTISYNWSDSQSNPAPTVTRTVNVLTGGIPVISLIGSGNVTILYGYSYIESGATAFDIEDGDLTS